MPEQLSTFANGMILERLATGQRLSQLCLLMEKVEKQNKRNVQARTPQRPGVQSTRVEVITKTQTNRGQNRGLMKSIDYVTGHEGFLQAIAFEVPSLTESMQVKAVGIKDIDETKSRTGEHFVELILNQYDAQRLAEERSKTWEAITNVGGLDEGILDSFADFDQTIRIARISPRMPQDKVAKFGKLAQLAFAQGTEPFDIDLAPAISSTRTYLPDQL
jgi:hypothetical protein